MSDATTKRSPYSVVRLISIVSIIGAVIVLSRALPIDRGIILLSDYVAGLGILGPILFGIAYIIAALFFVPGSLLTLTAGAIFGLAIGTITVAVSATTAGAIAFILSRTALRSRIEQMAAQNPKFAAIDTAISRGGWKIVGLLRLSPAVPFSIANYLFGLTKVRFSHYVGTSFFAMLPGTFMYVYLGYVGRASATAGQTGRSPLQWALLGVGLVATIVVTVYVTKLAKKALAETAVKDGEAKDAVVRDPAESKKPNERKGALILAGVAATLIAVSGYAMANKTKLEGLFGPPRVTLAEKFDSKPGGPVFDHRSFDSLLAAHVDKDGWVDYDALAAKRGQLDAYLRTLAEADLGPYGRDERLAFYINAYNGYTLALILNHPGIESIKEIDSDKRWDGAEWPLAGKSYSLNQIEHELIRAQFVEPRIHFAVNCASIGCPPLRNEAFTGQKIEAQLTGQTEYVHTHPRWFQFDPSNNSVKLTRLYQWYGSDFTQVEPSAQAFAARYAPRLAAALKSGPVSRSWLEYSWVLNDIRNRPNTPMADGRAADPEPEDRETAAAPVEAAEAAAAALSSVGSKAEAEPNKTATKAADPDLNASAGKTVEAVDAKPAGVKAAAGPTKPVKKVAPVTKAKPKAAAARKPDAKAEPKKAEPKKAEPKKAEPKEESGGSSSGGGAGGSSGAPIDRGFR